MLECKPICSLPLSLLFLGLHHRPMIIKWCHVSCSTSWCSLTTLNPSTALASLSFDPSQLFSLAFSSYGYLKTEGLNKQPDGRCARGLDDKGANTVRELNVVKECWEVEREMGCRMLLVRRWVNLEMEKVYLTPSTDGTCLL